MTKKEAQEMLINTKVYVNGKSKEIQEKLFEIGFRWDIYNNSVDYTNMPFLYMDQSLYLSFGSNMLMYKENTYKEISAEDILSIKIDEEYQFKAYEKVLVRDNDEDAKEMEMDYWICDIFSHMNTCPSACEHYRYVTIGGKWMECIPYSGNEHLIGTNKNP